jgi:hypothetical protein
MDPKCMKILNKISPNKQYLPYKKDRIPPGECLLWWCPNGSKRSEALTTRKNQINKVRQENFAFYAPSRLTRFALT